jgi:hypothetical protein
MSKANDKNVNTEANDKNVNINVNYKNVNMATFNTGFDIYKSMKPTKYKNSDQIAHLNTLVQHDYTLLNNIQKCFTILQNMLKFVIINDEQYYNTILRVYSITNDDELTKQKINFPQNTNDILCLYAAYPNAIDIIRDELFAIVNLDDFTGLYKLSKIPPLMTDAVLTDQDFMQFFEESYTELYDITKQLVKKVLKVYTDFIVKNKINI